jgi:hypothetical protein
MTLYKLIFIHSINIKLYNQNQILLKNRILSLQTLYDMNGFFIIKFKINI